MAKPIENRQHRERKNRRWHFSDQLGFRSNEVVSLVPMLPRPYQWPPRSMQWTMGPLETVRWTGMSTSPIELRGLIREILQRLQEEKQTCSFGPVYFSIECIIQQWGVVELTV